jgi:hypothetical protein
MSSKVLMPLRSNAAYFIKPEYRCHLERQLKMNLMLYDRVMVEQGRWYFVADKNGQGMAQFLPPKKDNQHPTKIDYAIPGNAFGIYMNGMPVLEAVCEVGCTADFFPILHDAKLLDQACYDWVGVHVEVSKESPSLKATEQMFDSCVDVGPQNPYARKILGKGLLEDTLLANHLSVPLSIDFEMAPVVAHGNATPDQRLQVCSRFLELSEVNFGDWHWDRILEARESDAGISFRRMIARIADVAAAAARAGETYESIRDLTNLEIQKELFKALSALQPTAVSTALSIGLNFVPFGTVIDIGQEIAALGESQQNWFSILKTR